MTAGALSLRPVGADDEAFLQRVYDASRDAELAPLGWSLPERRAFLDQQRRAQETDYARRFPGAEHAVVLDGEEPVGRIWVHRGEAEIRLLDVTILPDHQGRGIGTALLGRLQVEARRAGLPLRHTVLVTNTGARRLYERLGFRQVDTTETHALMEWTGDPAA